MDKTEDKMEDEEKSTTKNAEQILEDLGGCGKYQMRMGVVSHLMMMSMSWGFMSYVIVSKTPEFWCASDVNSNVTYIAELNNTEYDANKACVSVDGTKCTKFIFDDSLRTIMSDFNLVCDYAFTASTIMSIQNAGSVAGNLITGHIADLIGRKIPFFSSILIVTMAEFLSLGASGWVLIAVSRFLIGVATGAFLTIICSLLSEFTLAQHRSLAIGFPSWTLETSAFCLLAWLVHDWRYINLASAIIGIPCFFAWCIGEWFGPTVIFQVIPESFRWYLAHGKQEKAEAILEMVATYNEKPQVDPRLLEEIANAEESAKDRKYSVLDLFKSKQLIRTTVFLGIICNNTPFAGSSLWGIVRGELSFLTDTNLRGSLTNAFALTAYLFVVVVWGPVQTMTVELYPTVVRNIGLGSMAVFGSIGTIISPQFDYLGDVNGVPGLMYFACGVAAVLSFFSLFGLPETKDAYLDDTLPGTKRAKIVE